MASLTDNADYDAGETFGNVPRPRFNFRHDHADNGLRTSYLLVSHKNLFICNFLRDARLLVPPTTAEQLRASCTLPLSFCAPAETELGPSTNITSSYNTVPTTTVVSGSVPGHNRVSSIGCRPHSLALGQPSSTSHLMTCLDSSSTIPQSTESSRPQSLVLSIRQMKVTSSPVSVSNIGQQLQNTRAVSRAVALVPNLVSPISLQHQTSSGPRDPRPLRLLPSSLASSPSGQVELARRTLPTISVHSTVPCCLPMNSSLLTHPSSTKRPSSVRIFLPTPTMPRSFHLESSHTAGISQSPTKMASFYRLPSSAFLEIGTPNMVPSLETGQLNYPIQHCNFPYQHYICCVQPFQDHHLPFTGGISSGQMHLPQMTPGQRRWVHVRPSELRLSEE
ncbi:unnamed protein product [Protopolystoma xenopodis]|uniref:Uncharacterized protein n=1 Tax=Protopolystoma xenopodis TaxID=117903 RepID=A0A3S5CB98_9PLAT|nr:unnamed protein product [Protopolystoma xenopodis]